MNGHWRDALDCKAETLRAWSAFTERTGLPTNGEMFADYGGNKPPKGREDETGFAEMLYAMHRAILIEGEPIYVSEQVQELVAAATPRFAPEPFYAWDAFTPIGFAALDAPIFFDSDAEAEPVLATRAVSWVHVVDNEKKVHDDEPSFVYLMGWAEMPEWSRTGLLPNGCYAVVKMGETAEAAVARHMVPHAGRDRSVALATWIQVLWRIASQVVRTSEPTSRSVARGAVRAGVKETRETLVIRLRRQSAENGTPREVDWASQWIVRGHWRNQFYPSLDAHRQIWISPYVKGPEDKPLRDPTARAWEFVR